jgi:predicted RND superfamily exporter protein
MLRGLTTRLRQIPFERPRSVLVAVGLLVLAAAPGLWRLRVSAGAESLVPREADELKTDREVRARFGVGDFLIVAVETGVPGGIFDPEVLRLAQTLTAQLAAMQGVRPGDVLSLATERSSPIADGSATFQGLIEPLPRTAAELEHLRRELDDYRIYNGLLVSYRRDALAILVEVPPRADRSRLYRQASAIVAPYAQGPPRVALVGAPVAEALLGATILEDLGVPARWSGGGLPRPAAALAAGAPWLDRLRYAIARTVGLVPLAITVMALLFLISFHSLFAMLVPLAEVALCLVFVFGTMGWCGVPIHLTTAVLPAVLVALVMTDEIYIFNTYRRLLREGRPAAGSGSPEGARRGHVERVGETLAEIRHVIRNTSLTNAIGYLSFATSPLASVQAFGVFACLGLIFSMSWSLFVTPAAMVLGASPRLRRGSAAWLLPHLLDRLARWSIAHRRPVVWIAGGVALAALAGVSRVVVQDSWIECFSRQSDFRQAIMRVDGEFLGTHLLYLSIGSAGSELSGTVPAAALSAHAMILPGGRLDDAAALAGRWVDLAPAAHPLPGHPHYPSLEAPRRGRILAARRVGPEVRLEIDRGSPSLTGGREATAPTAVAYRIVPRRLLQPAAVAAVCDLEALVRGAHSPIVGGVLGPCEHLATMNFLASGRSESARRVPSEARRIDWVWRRYAASRGPNRRAELIDEDEAHVLVTVFTKAPNYREVERLTRVIRRFERARLAPLGLAVELAGDVAVSQAMIGAITGTERGSLLVSLIGILALATFLWRSAAFGALTVLPCGLALLLLFAAMGAFGVPLGIASSMFSAMVLGLGVDYAFHLAEAFRRRLPAEPDPTAAIVRAVSQTGPAVVINGTAVALGLGLMVLSQVPPNALLGGFVALSVLACLGTTLLLLPALLAMLGPVLARRRLRGVGRPGARV